MRVEEFDALTKGGSGHGAMRDAFPVVVHVMLVRDGRLFLLRRANTGFMDGFCGLPGGHQRRGESLLEAALRECREETGVAPTDLKPRAVLPYISAVHQGLNFIFEAQRWEGAPRINEPQRFDHCQWAPKEHLPAKVAPWLKELLALPPGCWFREFRWD